MPTPMPSPVQPGGGILLCAEWEEGIAAGQDDSDSEASSWLLGGALPALTMPSMRTHHPSELLLTAASMTPTCASLIPKPLASLGLGVTGFEIHGLPPPGLRPRPLGCVVPSKAVRTEAAIHYKASLRNRQEPASSKMSVSGARSAAHVLAAAAPSQALLVRAAGALAARGLEDTNSTSPTSAAWSALASCARTGLEQRAVLHGALKAAASEASLSRPHAVASSLSDWWMQPESTSNSVAPLLVVGSEAGCAMALLQSTLRSLKSGLGGESESLQGWLSPKNFFVPSLSSVPTAFSVESMMACREEMSEKKLISAQSLCDLSPAGLTSCMLLHVEKPETSSGCLKLLSLQGGHVVRDSKHEPAPLMRQARGGATTKPSLILIDDLSLPMPNDVASKPEALFECGLRPLQKPANKRTSPCYRDVASQLSFERKQPQLLRHQLSAVAGSFSLDLREAPPICSQDLVNANRAPVAQAWTTYLAAEKRAQMELPRLVASVRMRSMLASDLVMAADARWQEAPANDESLRPCHLQCHLSLPFEKALLPAVPVDSFCCFSPDYLVQPASTVVDETLSWATDHSLGIELDDIQTAE